jgi:hypothetical protein
MVSLHVRPALRAPQLPRSARRPLALLCLVLGVAGCVLPIIPGLPFLVICGRLLGPRDRLLRQGMLAGRRGLRRLRRAGHPALRCAGDQLTPHWHSFARLLLGRH